MVPTLSTRALNMRPCVLRSFAHDGISPHDTTRSCRVGCFAGRPLGVAQRTVDHDADGLGGRHVVIRRLPQAVGGIDGVELLGEVLVRSDGHVAAAHTSTLGRASDATMPATAHLRHTVRMQSWAAPRARTAVRATVALPGSKSLTNRLLLLAALADAPSRLIAPLRARDTELMAAALRGARRGRLRRWRGLDRHAGPPARRAGRHRPRRHGHAIRPAGRRAGRRRRHLRRRRVRA